MKKSLFILTLISLLSCPVLAQDMDLFPELKGRFKPAEMPKPEVKADETPVPKAESLPSSEGYSEDEDDDDTPTIPDSYMPELPSAYVPVNQPMPVNQPIPVDPDTFQTQQKEGNVRVQLTNLKGVLPYARNYSYCFADAVLTNQTNQTLQELHMALTYQGSVNDLKFAGVPKKGEQTQQIMMNGPECASILSMPQVEIKTCKMELQSDEACKKRIQFIAPNE